MAVLLALLTTQILVSAESGTDPRSEGTLRMVEKLRRVNAQMDVDSNPYENHLRAVQFATKAAYPASPQGRLHNVRLYATELLRSGASRDAVTVFEKALELESRETEAGRADYLTTKILLGTAWLRVAEQENCILHHGAQSCLFPIHGNGEHQLREGSEVASEIFRSVLKEDPARMDARWLLNICEMTLGRYPENVPVDWRIPESTLHSDHDIGRFLDVATDLGLDGNDLAGGTVVEDFNNDGHLDIMVSGVRRDSQLRYFQNRGDGTFEDRTIAAGLEGLTRGLNLVQADVNNDGFVDVLVLRGAWLGRVGRIPNSLLKNNGDGTFDDITEEAGLQTARPTQTAVFLDFDGDGWLDICIGNESSQGNNQRTELYRNNHDGTFEEVSFESGIKLFEFVKGVTSGDYNNDGRPDLFFSILGAPNRLFRNDGPGEEPGSWKFTDVSESANISEPMNSFPCWFFDYDNDGYEDIFVAGYDLMDLDDAVLEHLGQPADGDVMTLHRNRGDGTFENVSGRVNIDRPLLAMGCNFGDLDNDGWLDFYVGTGNPDFRALFPNKMFRNASGRFFQDVTSSGGFGHLQKGHAIAFADLDNDGDQDVYANMGGAYYGDVYRNAVFENPGHDNRWLKLQLVGTTSNRSALGARIRIEVNGPEGPRVVHRTVNSGGSFGSNPLKQEIGLGRATAVQSVEVFWPATGLTQKVDGIGMDQIYVVTEGVDKAENLRVDSTPFARADDPHSHHSH